MAFKLCKYVYTQTSPVTRIELVYHSTDRYLCTGLSTENIFSVAFYILLWYIFIWTVRKYFLCSFCIDYYVIYLYEQMSVPKNICPTCDFLGVHNIWNSMPTKDNIHNHTFLCCLCSFILVISKNMNDETMCCSINLLNINVINTNVDVVSCDHIWN